MMIGNWKLKGWIIEIEHLLLLQFCVKEGGCKKYTLFGQMKWK